MTRVEPVGEKLDVQGTVCFKCGYHRCSCEYPGTSAKALNDAPVLGVVESIGPGGTVFVQIPLHGEDSEVISLPSEGDITKGSWVVLTEQGTVKSAVIAGGSASVGSYFAISSEGKARPATQSKMERLSPEHCSTIEYALHKLASIHARGETAQLMVDGECRAEIAPPGIHPTLEKALYDAADLFQIQHPTKDESFSNMPNNAPLTEANLTAALENMRKLLNEEHFIPLSPRAEKAIIELELDAMRKLLSHGIDPFKPVAPENPHDPNAD